MLSAGSCKTVFSLPLLWTSFHTLFRSKFSQRVLVRNRPDLPRRDNPARVFGQVHDKISLFPRKRFLLNRESARTFLSTRFPHEHEFDLGSGSGNAVATPFSYRPALSLSVVTFFFLRLPDVSPFPQSLSFADARRISLSSPLQAPLGLSIIPFILVEFLIFFFFQVKDLL